jgi:signal transduction histidine kinase
VVIICSYLLVNSRGDYLAPTIIHGLLLFYILSNTTLYFIDDRLFSSQWFHTSLVTFDTLFITASLIITGQIASDFYLAYFLIIILCCICQEFRWVVVVAVLAPILYGYILFRSTEVYDPSIYLRLPFLFVISLFYGYFALAARGEKVLREQAEQEIQNMVRVNRAKSEFLTVVSHELRTPLHAAIAFTSMIQAGVFGEINPKQDEALGKVIGHGKDLLTMIESLLEASRIEAGAVKVESQVASLGNLLEELKAAYSVPVDKGLTLIWDYPLELPPMKIDRGKLKHILQNLINNAIKFTEKGCVTISVRHFPAAQTVKFQVADTGIGILQEALPVIFEKFRQMHTSDTRSHGGIGLGLFIVKKFTDLLGGTVEVESEVGKGSTFTVTIPYERTEQ